MENIVDTETELECQAGERYALGLYWDEDHHERYFRKVYRSAPTRRTRRHHERGRATK
jgi:hypothetical protein